MTQFNIETVRKARVSRIEKLGYSIDGTGCPDTNPDRHCVYIEPLNCSSEEFLEWFLDTQIGENYYQEDVNSFIDLSCNCTDLAVGFQFEVSYSEFFEFKINRMCHFAKLNLKVIAVQAILNLSKAE